MANLKLLAIITVLAGSTITGGMLGSDQENPTQPIVQPIYGDYPEEQTNESSTNIEIFPSISDDSPDTPITILPPENPDQPIIEPPVVIL